MELHTVHGILLVGEAHDFAFFGPGGDLKAIGQSFAFDDQRVIARGLKGIAQSTKNTGAIMVNR